MLDLVGWLFDRTDNINLIIEVGVGLVATAWVAGYWSKRKLQKWLTTEESDPYIDRVIKKIPKPEIPVVPALHEIAGAVEAKLPHIPTAEEITDQLEPVIQERISAAVSNAAIPIADVIMPRLQAMLASRENEARAEIAHGIQQARAQYPMGSQQHVYLDALEGAIQAKLIPKKYQKYLEMAKAGQQFLANMRGGGAPGQGMFPSGPSQMALYQQNAAIAAMAQQQSPGGVPSSRPMSATEVNELIAKTKAEMNPKPPEEENVPGTDVASGES
jgi:hypothetical protein